MKILYAAALVAPRAHGLLPRASSDFSNRIRFSCKTPVDPESPPLAQNLRSRRRRSCPDRVALADTLPIALGWGAGAESRRTLGLAVVGGLIVSQALTLCITPVFYLHMERFTKYLSPKPVAEIEAEAEAAAAGAHSAK